MPVLPTPFNLFAVGRSNEIHVSWTGETGSGISYELEWALSEQDFSESNRKSGIEDVSYTITPDDEPSFARWGKWKIRVRQRRGDDVSDWQEELLSPSLPTLSGKSFHVRGWVDNYLKSNLGEPILQTIGVEGDSIVPAIKNALVSYWTAFPYISSLGHEAGRNSGRLFITEDSIRERTFGSNWSANEKAVLLGIVRIDESNPVHPQLDSLLFGRGGGPGFGSFSRQNWLGRAVNLEQTLLQNTEQDIVRGEVGYNYDPIHRRFIFDVPYGQVSLVVWWSFGFFDDVDLLFMQESHMTIFSKMVLYEFLNIIVKGRSSVEISNDVQINISALESQMSDLKSELQEELQLFVQTPLVYG